MISASDSSRNSETRSAIQAFEEILDAFPDDLNTLEALFQAYESLNENDKAGVYILRAGRVAVQQTGALVSAVLADRLKRLAPTVREAALILSSLGEERLQKTPPHPALTADSPRDARLLNPAAAELELAWELKEAGLLTDSEYATAAQQLSDGKSDSGQNSLLALVQSVPIGDLEKIMAHLAKETGVAILPISNFDTPASIASLLPPEFMTTRGAVAFETIGTEPLVAVLNPRDAQLRKEVEEACGKTCHFFLTSPAEMNAWIQRSRDSKPRA